MISFKKLLTGALIAVMLVGCQQGETVPAKATLEETNKIIEKAMATTKLTNQHPLNNEITIALVGNPETLNPFYASDHSSMTVLASIYEKMYFTAYGQPAEASELNLLEGLTMTDSTITLTLKEGITWHDGTPMTSKDMAFTFDYIKTHPDSIHTDLFSRPGREIAVNVVDDRTITLVTSEPSQSFMYALSQVTIVPEHIFKTIDEKELLDPTTLVGNGPFIYDSKDWDTIYVVPNTNFFGEAPKLAKIAFRVIEHETTARFSVVKSQAQAGFMRPSDYDGVENTPVNTHVVDEGTVRGILFKTASPQVSDVETREAITYLINRDTYRDTYATPQMAQLANSVFSDTTAYRTAQEYYYVSDGNKALKILRKKVEDNPDFKLRMGYLVDVGEPHDRFSIALEEAFRGIDIPFEAIPLFDYEYWKAVKDPSDTSFDFCMFDYAIGENPDAYAALFKTGGLYNYSGYGNPEIDELFDEGDRALSPMEAQQVYDRLQSILLRDKPYEPVLYTRTVIATDDRLKGIEEAIPAPHTLFRHFEHLYVDEFDPESVDVETYEINREIVEKDAEKVKIANDKGRLERIEVYKKRPDLYRHREILTPIQLEHLQ